MKYLRDIIVTIIAAIAFYIFLQLTIGTFKVNGTSSVPTVVPGDCLVVNKLSYLFKNPDRGEKIILQSPRANDTDLIKRIIALPGDTIEIKNGKVFVNKMPVVEPYIKEPPRYEYPLQKIPEGEYFVLGDNRNVASDSHEGWYVPRENIVAKVWICYWPLNRWGVIKHYNFATNGYATEVIDSISEAGKLWPMK